MGTPASITPTSSARRVAFRRVPGTDAAHPGGVGQTRRLTSRGAATRERILLTAADLTRAQGDPVTTLEDVRAASATSKSQLYHHFPLKCAPCARSSPCGRDRSLERRDCTCWTRQLDPRARALARRAREQLCLNRARTAVRSAHSPASSPITPPRRARRWRRANLGNARPRTAADARRRGAPSGRRAGAAGDRAHGGASGPQLYLAGPRHGLNGGRHVIDHVPSEVGILGWLDNSWHRLAIKLGSRGC